ncbi:hypothetical protein Tco_1055684 [Tanacetum coccineum]|uniref:MULE transposase domain-containing protein n=1 Tax=Tanacetum coccineum TaxID=301880 RepID=A0ABQ5H263_9ASTR
MVADVREKFMINVSVHQCRRATQRAVYDHEGGLIDHYAKLWDYKNEILSTNPGLTVQLDVDTLDDGKTQFKRIYHLPFKPMKEGWTSCRRVVRLYVVSIENSENWLWFLSHLGSDFNLAMGAYLTILSDGHKAVKELLPHAEHRLCARHIYAIFKEMDGLPYRTLCSGVCNYYIRGVVHALNKLNMGKSAQSTTITPKKRIMPGRPRKNRIKPITKGVNQLSRADSSFVDPSSADRSAAESSFVDPSSADPSAADPTFANPNQSFTGLLNYVEQQIMGADITDAEIAALADMNEEEEREARRKDVERVLEKAKKKEGSSIEERCWWIKRIILRRIAKDFGKEEERQRTLMVLG